MRIVFMGSPEFAEPSLRAVAEHHDVAVVVSQPDKRSGRGKKTTSPRIADVARELGIELSQPQSARRPEFAEQMRGTGADLAVVVAYGKILPPAVLEAFPRGCVNVHGSLLPKYRGAAPIQWSIIDGDDETGVSIMQLDEGMDTGPVFHTRSIEIEATDTYGTLSDKLAVLGADALIDTLAAIERGDAVAVAQDDAGASHARMLVKADGWIDWREPARAVADRIRGVDPWPGAVALLEGERVKLLAPEVVAHSDASAEPGTVVSVGSSGFAVACGDGAVRIGRAQAPGKRAVTAAEFARGRRLEVGHRLGNLDRPEEKPR